MLQKMKYPVSLPHTCGFYTYHIIVIKLSSIFLMSKIACGYDYDETQKQNLRNVNKQQFPTYFIPFSFFIYFSLRATFHYHHLFK